jgi:hypothetical protein
VAADTSMREGALPRTAPTLDSPRRLLEVLLWTLVALVCVAGIGTMLIVPTPSKTVGLVYGGF